MLSDIQLPGNTNGLALLRQLRGTRPGLPGLLMTSLPPQDSLHAQAASEFQVLQKPFDPGDLGAALQGRARVAAQ